MGGVSENGHTVEGGNQAGAVGAARAMNQYRLGHISKQGYQLVHALQWQFVPGTHAPILMNDAVPRGGFDFLLVPNRVRVASSQVHNASDAVTGKGSLELGWVQLACAVGMSFVNGVEISRLYRVAGIGRDPDDEGHRESHAAIAPSTPVSIGAGCMGRRVVSVWRFRGKNRIGRSWAEKFWVHDPFRTFGGRDGWRWGCLTHGLCFATRTGARVLEPGEFPGSTRISSSFRSMC